ncbi:MAG: terminase gpA endonuclease subunit [Rickettsiales bacterium]
MARDTPALKGKISESKRDGDNTILHKKFPGGHLTVSGANSPASLASRPIRFVLLDEVDRYPSSAGKEGDPANLAVKRSTTFWNRKIVYVSSPTVKDESRIEAAYMAGDRRAYKVPCPRCGEYQELSFWRLKRPYDDAPAYDWFYECAVNNCVIEERKKSWMLARGFWEATAPFNGVASFWIHEIYSPWVTWAEMVENFLEAKKLPDTLKTFVNTSLAELWDQEKTGEGVTADSVEARTETYEEELPEGVYVVTAAVDVQDDRLEIEFLGWGMDRETWSIDYVVKHGDPGIPEVWEELDGIIEREFDHALGVKMRAAVVCVDAGGHHAQRVYDYVKKKAAQRKRVYAVRGHSVRGQPILAKVSRNNAANVKVHYVGTDTAKEMIYSQLKIERHGPGYMHHPEHYDAEYFSQLTSERKQTVYKKGQTVTEWVKPKARRNEALDVKVYNFAAFWILKANMAMVKKKFLARVRKHRERTREEKTRAAPKNPDSPPPVPQATIKPKRRRVLKRKPGGGYVKNW